MAEGDLVCNYCGDIVEDITDWIQNHDECFSQVATDESNYLFEQAVHDWKEE